jgi:hypothetical protein
MSSTQPLRMVGAVWLAATWLGGTALAAQVTPAPTPVIAAVKLGDLQRVRDLLAKGADANTADRRGFTPLIWAAAVGNVELVQQLIKSGAAVNLRASDGTTSLMLASANGFVEVARALLLAGANVSATRGGISARQLALSRGQTDIVALLEQSETLGSRLLQAVEEGNDTVVRQLLTLGAPASVSDARGTTPLMIAARSGELGMLQTLLSRGADPLMRDIQGESIFEWAERSPSTGKYVVAFLIDRGVSRQAPPAGALARAPQVGASLRALASLLGRIPPASAPLRTARERADTALSRLLALSAKWPAESPDDYRDNLARHVATLEAALKAGDLDALAAMLREAAEDLEVKLEHCNMSGGRLGGSVTVRVRTVQGTAESRSWQVFYMPRIFEAAANASPDLFPQLSSPTEEVLVPGRYLMWVRDPASGRLGERTIVKVGEGRKELLLDLPVPSTER